MIFLDLILRTSCLTLLLLLIINLLRQKQHSQQTKLLLLSCVSVGCLLVGLSPLSGHLPSSLYFGVRLLDIPHLIFIWLFGLSLFRHQFHVTRWHLLFACLYCGPIVWVRLAQFGLLSKIDMPVVLLANLLTVLLITHLLYCVIKGRKDDLSEERRAARLQFVFLVSFMAILISLSEVVLVQAERDLTIIGTIKTAAIFPAILWTCLWLLPFNSKALTFDSVSSTSETWLSADKLLYNRIRKELSDNQPFLEPGLSIMELASRVMTTEAKLRAFINQRLGYTNFSTFINSYRIDSVKRDFENPELADTPILTIALNNGFASLSPFNRAFIKFVGQTPTQYRKLALKSHK